MKANEMPNEITNFLTITGPSKSLMKFREMAVGRSPMYRMKENEKHLQNELLEANPILKMMLAARVNSGETFQFHNFIPIPKKVLEAGYNEKGRDWEYENWGVQWGAIYPKILDEETNSRKLVYKFGTAWSTPQLFFKGISRQFPELLFVCEFLDFEQPYLPARIIEYKKGQLRADRPGSQIEIVTTDWYEDGSPRAGHAFIQRDKTS